MKTTRTIIALLALMQGVFGQTRTGGSKTCCNTQEWNNCVRQGFAGCCYEKGLVPEFYCCNKGPGGGPPNGKVLYVNERGQSVEGKVKIGELAEVKGGKLTSTPVPAKGTRPEKEKTGKGSAGSSK
ncbi:MAG: hypothetical protein JNL98_12670 [Bryobacterales bacterium]|nr:hypothetical protein [Bryobacterales bacterium]